MSTTTEEFIAGQLDKLKESTKAALELAYQQIDELTEKYNQLHEVVVSQTSLINTILNVEIPRIDGRIAVTNINALKR